MIPISPLRIHTPKPNPLEDLPPTYFNCQPLGSATPKQRPAPPASARVGMSNNAPRATRAVLPSLPELQKKPVNPQTDAGVEWGYKLESNGQWGVIGG